MITETILRARKRGFELDVESYNKARTGARTPQLEQIDAKKAEAEAAIERIEKALKDLEGTKKPEYPPLLAGVDPMILVPETKKKNKRGKGKRGTAKRDKIAFALEK